MNTVISVIGALSGVLALVVSVWGVNQYEKKQNTYLAVHEFLSKIESDEMIKAKRHVYEMQNQPESIAVTDEEAAKVVNCMHHWGLLAKKGYLPMWVFEEGSGGGAMRLYSILEPYIMLRRKVNQDETFGSGFEWLNRKLSSK